MKAKYKCSYDPELQFQPVHHIPAFPDISFNTCAFMYVIFYSWKHSPLFSLKQKLTLVLQDSTQRLPLHWSLSWLTLLSPSLYLYKQHYEKLVLVLVQSLSRIWLSDPMNRSTPGLPVHHQLPEFTQTHVLWVSDAIQPSHPLSSLSPTAPNPSQHQSFFQWVNSLHEVAKVLEFQL